MRCWQWLWRIEIIGLRFYASVTGLRKNCNVEFGHLHYLHVRGTLFQIRNRKIPFREKSAFRYHSMSTKLSPLLIWWNGTRLNIWKAALFNTNLETYKSYRNVDSVTNRPTLSRWTRRNTNFANERRSEVTKKKMWTEFIFPQSATLTRCSQSKLIVTDSNFFFSKYDQICN